MEKQMRNALNQTDRVALIRWTLIAVMLAAVAGASMPLAAEQASRNLVVNADFARTYAAHRSPEPWTRNMPGLDKDAAMPYAWTVQPSRWTSTGPDTIGTVSPVRADSGAALRVVTKKSENMRLRQYVEVVPEAAYTCAVWIKGKGAVTIRPQAYTPAVGQDLGTATAQATAEWTKVQLAVKIGYHRHVANLNIEIGEDADVQLRGVEFSAPLPASPLPEALVTAKPIHDEDTLYLEDFDGISCSFDVGKDCKLTADNGGRFGRGLIVTPTAGGAKARLHFGKLPETGTIEFWYKPTALPEANVNTSVNPLTLTTPAAYKQLVFQVSSWQTTLRFGFQKEQWDSEDPWATSAGLGNNGWGFWQVGTWHHLAGSWDGQAVRLYVDGQLEGLRIQGGVQTDWSCPGKDIERPNGEALELVLPAAGVVDEIRVSKGLRFGPFVPQGATNPPLLMVQAAAGAPRAAGGQHLETSEKDLNAARLKVISKVPEVPAIVPGKLLAGVQAAYVFGANQAKPAWEGMAGMSLLKDCFGPGADGVKLEVGIESDITTVRDSAMYWKLPDIKPGKYYVGLWQETGGFDARLSEFSQERILTCLYLNGYPVRFATTSDPVQVKPPPSPDGASLWLGELQTGQAVSLKPGDELEVRPQHGWRADGTFLRLVLYVDPPQRGHGVTGQFFGGTFGSWRSFPRLRLAPKIEITGSGEAGTQHEARIAVANPLPYEVQAVIDWKLSDYFGNPVAGKPEKVTIQPHAVATITHIFTAQSDARAYQVNVKTRAAEGFLPPVSRGVEMIELNDWGKLEFLPNLPGPLETWTHMRKDLTSMNTGDRRSFSLDGAGWERSATSLRRVPAGVPADIQWSGCNLPSWEWWPPKEKFGFWYRKKFQTPKWLRGQTLQLEIGKAYREGTAFLNGHKLEGVCRGNIPLFADVTGLLKLDGENELVILVRADVALAREDYIDRYTPDAWIENDAHRDFPPTDDNIAAGLGYVWLRALPAVRVRQTLVVPDVDHGEVIVFNRVQNTRDTAVTVELQYSFAQEGKAISNATVPSRTVTLKPGEIVEVKSVGKVTPPRGAGFLGLGRLFEPKSEKEKNCLQPYTPAQPILTQLATSILENGKALDVQEVRFGYRTVKVKGAGLTLNGQPVTFLGTGPEGIDLFEGEDGTTVSRCAPLQMDEMDEIGRFHYPYASMSWPAAEWELLNNDRYWQRDQDQGVEQVWIHGSRPSTIGFNLSNECYNYACYSVGGEGQSKLGERFHQVKNAIDQRVWPDFWFLSDGNESLGNRISYTSWHYLNHGWAGGYQYGTGVNQDAHKGLTDTASYPPDSFYLGGAAREPRPGDVVHATNRMDDWHPGMACASTEEFWFTGTNNGPSIAKFVGDRAVISPAWQFFSGRGMWWGKLSIDAYRDMGASVLGVYPHNFLGMVMQAVTFDMPQQEIRYYSGAKFDRRINIHDDEFSPGKLKFTWKLLGPGDKELSHGTFNTKSGTMLLHRERVTFNVPKVTERTQFTLDMALRKDDKLREHEQRIVEVWPAATPITSTLHVALFDPQGKTQALLERFGCKVKPLAAISPEALADCRLLVVGPQSVMGNMPAEREAIQRFAEGGGRVLVLPQTENGILPGESFLEKRNFSSMGFVRASNHPVMQGFKDMDFAMWHWPADLPGHLVGRGLYRTPNRGNFLSLVECFHLDQQINVIAWTPLFEMYLGNGSILVTQLPLMETLDTEPMAAQMWRRILDYLGKNLHKHPQASLAVMDSVSEPVLNRLKDLRTDFKIVNQVDASSPVTLVEMNQPDLGKSTESFRKYVQDGGVLILHRARPEHQAFLADLTGKKVSVELQLYRSWVDRQMIEKRDGLAEGLSNVDFYWRPNTGGENMEGQMQVSGVADSPKGQVEYVVKVEGETDYLFPGGWVEVRLGNGRIVIDQVKWEVPEKEKNDYGSPMRVASMLLSNLGVVQKLPAPKPALPRDVRFETLDLAPLANTGFRDDKAGDGVGWLDWGPEQDIRDFPTGEVNMGGVPFKVAKGDKNSVTLRVNPDFAKSLANCPETVEIPVNKKNVAGLVYLHTGGWTTGLKPYGWREVHYTDGTQEVMALNNTNFGDWNYGHDQFPDEEGTTTNVAWKCACKNYPVTRVYMTTWVNPHPEKEIAKIVITNRNLPVAERRFLTHLAVTVAFQAETKGPVGPARDAKKSQALLQEAISLRQAKKTADAIAKLEEAIKADDQNVGAWITLTEIHSAADGVEAFTSLCKRWFAAMPTNYQAHNVLGKYLESKGKLVDALTEYKKSLELEWNQPPTIEDKTRVEKLLNQK